MCECTILIKIIVRAFDLMFTGDGFSILSKVVSVSGFVCNPSGNHGAIFADVVIISFISDK